MNCPTVLDTACRKNTCQPLTGKCQLSFDETQGTGCNDGNACTAGDFCINGKCEPGQSTCECQTHADCIAKDDGDFCNGTLVCDKSGKAPKCVVNPLSVVVCPKVADGACAVDKCDPLTGKCVVVAIAGTATCTDNDSCTVDDGCTAGQCIGKARSCDDNNKCTHDACDAKTGCTNTPNVQCEDDNPCTVDACNAITGKCVHDAGSTDGKTCDADGTPCTQGDVCQSGTCVAGAKVVCKQPTDVCLVAVCSPVGTTDTKCVTIQAPSGTDCDDGKGCVGGAVCSGGKCAVGSTPRLLGKTVIAPVHQPVKAGESVVAVLPMADGRTVVVGSKDGYSTGNVYHARFWVARLTSTGVTEHSVLLDKLGHAIAHDATRLDNGKVAAVGVNYAAGTVGQLVYLSAGGDKVEASHTFVDKEPLARERLTRVVAGPGGSITTLGRRSKGSGETSPHAMISRVVGGARTWLYREKLADTTHANAVSEVGMLANSDGGVTVSVVGVAKSPQAPYLVRVSSQGKLLWRKSMDGLGSGTSLRSGVELGDTMAWVGERGTTTKQALVAQIGADGAVVSKHVPFAQGVLQAVVARSDGNLVVAGYTPNGSGVTGLLAGLDLAGNTIWSRNHGLVSGRYRGLATVGDGVLVAGGHVDASKDAGTTGYFARFSEFGHTDCSAASACWGKTAKGCDDGKVCTRDDCVAKDGCVHPNHKSNVTCPTGSACAAIGTCDGGSCKTPDDGLAFIKEYNSNVHQQSELGGFALRDNGDLGLAMAPNEAGKFDGRVRILAVGDKGGAVAGTTLISTTSQGYELDNVRGLFPGADGAWVYCASFRGLAGSLNSSRVHVIGAKPNGKGGWTKAFSVSPEKAIGSYYGHTLVDCGVAGNGNIAVVHVNIRTKSNVPNLLRVGFFNSSGTALGNPLDIKYGTNLASAVGVEGHDSNFLLYGHAYDSTAKTHFGYAAIAAPHVVQAPFVYSTRPGSVFRNARKYGGGWITTASQNGVGWFVAALAGNKLQWEWFPVSQGIALADVAVTSDGMIALAGWKSGQSGNLPWLAKGPVQSAFSWERTYSPNKATVNLPKYQRVLQPLDKGGLAMALAMTRSGKKFAWLAKTDAWGNSSCADAGKCFDTAIKSCDDANTCTADSCEGTKGCVNAPVKAGTPCDDGQVCSQQDQCALGKCTAGIKPLDCDDNNDCTVDKCHQVLGCQNPVDASKEGKDCDDDDPCSSAGSCKKGVCIGQVTYPRFTKVVPHVGWTASVAIDRTDDGLLLAGSASGKGAVIKTDTTGKAIWSTALLHGQDSASADAILGHQGGAYVGVSTRVSNSYRGYLTRLDKNGKQVFARQVYSAQVINNVLRVPGSSDVIVVGLAFTDSGKSRLPALNRYTDAGQYLKAIGFVNLKTVAELRATMLPSGTVVLSGKRVGPVSGKDHHLWAYVTMDKELQSRLDVGTGYVGAAVQAGLLQVGHAGKDSQGKAQLYVSSINPTTNAITTRAVNGVGDTIQPRGLLPLRKDGVVLFASSKAGTQGRIVIARSSEKTTWVRSHGSTAGNVSAARLTPAVAMPDGGYAVLGTLDNGGTQQPWLLRVGPHGYADCQKAGACAYTDCDDGGACMADDCDVSKGCVGPAGSACSYKAVDGPG